MTVTLGYWTMAFVPAFQADMSESNPIILTERAAAKVRELRDDEGNPDLKLRVYITGGGCAGFSYGFTFDEQVNEDDTAVNREDVTLLVDAMSIQYLDGSEVDYEQGLMGSRFIVHNPNAATTCGCGSSFSV
ncbi:iron-sulfur cluster insertion protein ErpA [Alloalcanivorax gelatiniphagus]